MKPLLQAQLSVWAFTLAEQDPGSWQGTFDYVQAADRAGVDRAVLTGEHVVFGEALEAYGRPELGGRTGSTLPGPDIHFIEPIVTMSMIAALTKQIRFTTNILLAALRRPVVLAKMTSTLDRLSGGRLDLGVGVGWQREEYEAAGVDFDMRGRALDQSLEVCQLLWREQRASYASPDLSFENIHMMPKPANPQGVPIWVSGNVTPPAMRRLARFGAGWIPWGDATESNDALIEEIPRMRDAVAKLGRDPMDIQISGNLPIVAGPDGKPAIGPTMEKVPALQAAGVTDFRAMLLPSGDPAAAEDHLSAWVQAFRLATA